jgi:RsiW-degrading membrane proteinase PrsW (M82 family)
MVKMAGFLVSFLLGLIPCLIFAYIVYWFDRYEKEPKLLLGGVFTWGAIVAAGGAFIINSVLSLGVYIFTGSDFVTEVGVGSFIAPLVEETLKGLAVLIVYLIFRNEFDSILDGIVYAAITALGFAATENIYYIYSYGFQEHGWGGLVFLAFVRIILVGWQHPFYTAFTGIGLAISRLNRNTFIKFAAPVAGWMLAIFTHAFHNTVATLFTGLAAYIVGSLFDWTGWLFMFGFVLWAINRDRLCNVKYLKEEIATGLINPSQYKTACSAWSQGIARFNALTSGRYRQTNRFYQLCSELAHKKQLLLTLGEEGSNSQKIEKIRLELVRLAPNALS